MCPFLAVFPGREQKYMPHNYSQGGQKDFVLISRADWDKTFEDQQCKIGWVYIKPKAIQITVIWKLWSNLINNFNEFENQSGLIWRIMPVWFRSRSWFKNRHFCEEDSRTAMWRRFQISCVNLEVLSFTSGAWIDFLVQPGKADKFLHLSKSLGHKSFNQIFKYSIYIQYIGSVLCMLPWTPAWKAR